jgi:Tol biopolymer transport system component
MKRMRNIRVVVVLAGVASLAVLVPGAPANATFAGANGRISFTHGGAGQLYTANPDGSHMLQVTDVPSYCTEWSPDGTRLAYTFFEPDGTNKIATVHDDGSGQQIVAGPQGAITECPSWSPDQSKMVFDFSPTTDPNTAGFSTHLYVMNANGTDPRPLLSPSVQGFDVEPRWQPTGDLITFARIRKGTRGIQQEAVFVVKTDGTGLRQLTSDGLAPEHPTWSPDGRWITFNDASYKPGVQESVWVMRPDGTDRHVVFQGTSNSGGVKPQFSPDGRKILFTCVTYGSAFGNGAREDVCIMNADGTGIVDVTNTPDEFENQPGWGTAPLR